MYSAMYSSEAEKAEMIFENNVTEKHRSLLIENVVTKLS
jgi:hypothetical protein